MDLKENDMVSGGDYKRLEKAKRYIEFNVLGLMNYMNTELLIGMSCDLENAFDALPKFTAMLQSIEVNE